MLIGRFMDHMQQQLFFPTRTSFCSAKRVVWMKPLYRPCPKHLCQDHAQEIGLDHVLSTSTRPHSPTLKKSVTQPPNTFRQLTCNSNVQAVHLGSQTNMPKICSANGFFEPPHARESCNSVPASHHDWPSWSCLGQRLFSHFKKSNIFNFDQIYIRKY